MRSQLSTMVSRSRHLRAAATWLVLTGVGGCVMQTAPEEAEGPSRDGIEESVGSVRERATGGDDPRSYAYDSEMAADGWYHEPQPSGEARIAARRDCTDFDCGPDPDIPDVYSVTIRSLSTNRVELAPSCPGQAQLYRKVGDGRFSRIDTVDCARHVYVDDGLEPGTRYCYQIRSGSSGDSSTSACGRTPHEPFVFDSLATSRSASERMMERFDWERTDPVHAGRPDDPTLWYMNVLVTGEHDVSNLRALGMHAQREPIFREEIRVWDSSNDVVEVDGEVVGQWAYALVPGAIYNDIRKQMRDRLAEGEEPGFAALVFRRVPDPAAERWSTRVSPVDVEHLGRMGLDYNGYSSCREVGGTRVCQTRRELVGWATRKLYHIVVEFVDEVVEGVRRVVGAVEKLVRGEVELTLEFELLNTDSEFSGPMASGWRGEDIPLANTNVQIKQGLSIFQDATDARGRVQIEVAKGRPGDICLELENEHLEITSFFAERTVCVDTFDAIDGDGAISVSVQNDLVNAYASMSDAAEYVETVMDFDMPKIHVLTGWLASHSGGGSASFAPCLGVEPVYSSLVADLVVSLFPPLGLAAKGTEAFYSVDIILKPDDEGSRGVPVHEYGHTVMCSMMRDASRTSTDVALPLLLESLLVGDRMDPSKEDTYLTEALADFLTLQVVGGTNYVKPDGPHTQSRAVNYCHAGSDCFEHDFHEESGSGAHRWRDELRRVVSILQDAFDNDDASALSPNDGSHWRDTGSALVSSTGVDSNASDEDFELSGRDMPAIYDHWASLGNTLSEHSFLGGLGELLLSHGHSHRDVCELFAAHSSSGQCPDYIQDLDAWCPPFDPDVVDWSFCRDGCCEIGQGDCDSNDHCAPGLYCAQNNGDLFGQRSNLDLCTRDETLSVFVSRPDGVFARVTSSPGGISCHRGYCRADFQHGETVELRTTRRASWSGCDRRTATTCTVTMDGRHRVRARFDGPSNTPPPGSEPPVCVRKPYLPQCQTRPLPQPK